MLFKKDELRILWPFYLTGFLNSVSMIIIPFIVIYFRDLNFSFFHIAVLFAGFAATSFIFEIPTGAFADGFSRKYSAVFGFFLSGLAIFLITFSTNFLVLLFLWSLTGLGMTFISGAWEAWVVDNLKVQKRQDLRQEYFTKSYSFSSVGMVFAPLVAAFIVKNGSTGWLWMISGFLFLLQAFVLALFGNELYKPKRLHIIKSFKRTWHNSKKALKFSFSHKTVLYLIIGSVFISLLVFGENGWQPFLINLSLPQYALGYVYSIVAVGWVLGPFVPKLFKKVDVIKAAIIVVAFRMTILLCALLVNPPFFIFAAAILILEQSGKAVSDPLLFNYIHKFIPSRIRATVISIKSMAIQMFAVVSGLTAGVLQDYLGPQKVIALGAFFGVFAIATFLKMKDRNFPAKT